MIAFLAESMEGFIRRGETIADNVSGMVGELKLDKGTAVDQLGRLIEILPKVQAAGEQVFASELAGAELPKALEAGQAMLNSGIMDKQVIETLGKVGQMLAQAYLQVSSQPVQSVGGFWGTLRASKDPMSKSPSGLHLRSRKRLPSTSSRKLACTNFRSPIALSTSPLSTLRILPPNASDKSTSRSVRYPACIATRSSSALTWSLRILHWQALSCISRIYPSSSIVLDASDCVSCQVFKFSAAPTAKRRLRIFDKVENWTSIPSSLKSPP